MALIPSVPPVSDARIENVTDVRFDADTQKAGGPTDATPLFFPVAHINGYSRGMNPDAADNSGAIQDVINKVLESALEPKFGALIPGGEFHITNDIEIPYCVGLELGGVGRHASKLIQDTNNTPILNFQTDPDAHTVRAHDLFLGWNTQQTTSHTGSQVVLLGGDANSQANYFTFERLYLSQGYQGIVATATGNAVPWGMNFDAITASRFTGSIIKAIDSGGKPNWRVDKVFISNAGTGVLATEPAIYVAGASEFVIHNLDIEGWNTYHLDISGAATPVLIDAYHMENSTFGDGIWRINQISDGGFIARDVSADFTVNQTFNELSVFFAASGTDAPAEIHGMNITATNLGASTVYPCRIDVGPKGKFSGIRGTGVTAFPINPGDTGSVTGLIEYNGEYYDHPVTKTANYTATRDDRVILVDATAGARTITLPAAAGYTGKQYTIKRTSAANNVVVDGDASETIDGATTKTITTQFGFLTILCDGVGWQVIASGGTIT